jgi:protein-L-isoaspartate(D-aspartate) O-methyltransferase
MGRVRRQLFVPAAQRRQTYADYPLPIGSGQTISQPYVVAFMTEALGLTGSERVLEVGTGSGYQAAILAELSQKVYSVEIIESLSRTAGEVLGQLGYDNVHLRVGDGYGGWPEKAPFQAIMVTAAPDHVPPALLEQLAPGGKMVLPVGRHYQDLVLIERRGEGFHRRKILPVRFVPMRGAAEKASGRAQ